MRHKKEIRDYDTRTKNKWVFVQVFESRGDGRDKIVRGVATQVVYFPDGKNKVLIEFGFSPYPYTYYNLKDHRVRVVPLAQTPQFASVYERMD
jgi:hypothetical protein